MKSMIYKKKSPLIVFLVPAFLFIIVFLYYPFSGTSSTPSFPSAGWDGQRKE